MCNLRGKIRKKSNIQIPTLAVAAITNGHFFYQAVSQSVYRFTCFPR